MVEMATNVKNGIDRLGKRNLNRISFVSQSLPFFTLSFFSHCQSASCPKLHSFIHSFSFSFSLTSSGTFNGCVTRVLARAANSFAQLRICLSVTRSSTHIRTDAGAPSCFKNSKSSCRIKRIESKSKTSGSGIVTQYLPASLSLLLCIFFY